jgi:hypothetical protein
MSTRQHQAPDRSYQQRMDALDKANTVRSKRKHIKRDLKAGRVQPLPLLVDPPWWLDTFKVMDLLIALPKKGRIRADQVLRHHRISPSKTLGGLSDRQRQALAQHLREDRS